MKMATKVLGALARDSDLSRTQPAGLLGLQVNLRESRLQAHCKMFAQVPALLKTHLLPLDALLLEYLRLFGQKPHYMRLLTNSIRSSLALQEYQIFSFFEMLPESKSTDKDKDKEKDKDSDQSLSNQPPLIRSRSDVTSGGGGSKEERERVLVREDVPDYVPPPRIRKTLSANLKADPSLNTHAIANTINKSPNTAAKKQIEKEKEEVELNALTPVSRAQKVKRTKIAALKAKMQPPTLVGTGPNLGPILGFGPKLSTKAPKPVKPVLMNDFISETSGNDSANGLTPLKDTPVVTPMKAVAEAIAENERENTRTRKPSNLSFNIRGGFRSYLGERHEEDEEGHEDEDEEEEEMPRKVISHHIYIRGTAPGCSAHLSIRIGGMQSTSMHPQESQDTKGEGQPKKDKERERKQETITGIMVPHIKCDSTGLGCHAARQQTLFVRQLTEAIQELGDLLFDRRHVVPRRGVPVHEFLLKRERQQSTC